MIKHKKVKFNLGDSEQSNISRENENRHKDSKLKKDSMIVAVRCRPLNNREVEFSNIETIKIMNKEIVSVLDPIEYKGQEEVLKNRSKEHQFAFDYAFNKITTQEEVYKNTTKTLLPGLLEGYNATVLAYGATGAGKTYTMVGNGDNPGVMVRSLSDMFNLIQSEKDKDIKIKISYLEVYNETLRDLLASENEPNEIDMREDMNKGILLVGLREILVTDSADVFKLLIKGNKNRTEEATIHNQVSSRSHAVLQVNLEIKDKVVGLDMEITLVKFILIDLAGSERNSGSLTNASSKISAIRQNESSNINKSLLALANCINSLVDSGNKSGKTFIPWRDSKLTRILKVFLSLYLWIL